MNSIQNISQNTKLVASNKSWIEGNALEQLKKTALLPNITAAAGLPDLHPGKGHPVGAVFISENIIYPYIIGNDIGCGIGLWQTDLNHNKIKRDKWVKRLSSLESQEFDIPKELCEEFNVKKSGFENALGTIGKGNHFAELLKVHKVYSQKDFSSLNINEKKLLILVHCGSRGLGEYILRSYVDEFQNKGVDPYSKEGLKYIESHDNALNYAKLNRHIIASNFASRINAKITNVIDCIHNSITSHTHNKKEFFFHRKGVVSSLNGPVVVAGTRGSLSYIVKPLGNDFSTGHSISHGAGRKWKRGEAKGKLENYLTAQNLTHTDFGSRVICDDKDVLFQEAPQAYKDIERVIQDMEEAKLIKVIASVSPIITYKTLRRNNA